MSKRQPKRYDLVQVNACYTTDHEMEPADDGEWIRYDDIADLGCRCVCHQYPEHGKLQDALEALRWHQEQRAKAVRS